MQVAWLNRAIGWCDVLLAGHHAIPAAFGLASGVALVVGFLRVAIWLRHRKAVIRSLQGGSQPVEILPTTLPAAFAVPGRLGHVVVSQGMLDFLDGPQRAALIAHEQAHLDHRHPP